MIKHTTALTPRQSHPFSSPQAYLTRHAQQRSQGIPVLTVLLGSLDDTQEMWCHWMQKQNKDTVIWSPAAATSLSFSWIETLLAQADLQNKLLQHLAQTQRCTAEQLLSKLRNKSGFELKIFQQQLSVHFSAQASLLLNWLLTQIVCARALIPDLAEDLAQTVQLRKDNQLAQNIAIFAELFPMKMLPSILVTLPDSADVSSYATYIQTLAQVAENLLEIPVALSITPASFENYCGKTPESKVKAMLRLGVIEMPFFLDEDHGLPAETAQILHQYDAPSSLYQEAKSLQQLLTKNKGDLAQARSQAELFLFRMLELAPETRGLFKLNVKMPFKFGNRSMEIDLFANSVRIALEVDGYYHFQDQTAWRRDRRKDLVLQMQNILVLRFLAEDVVSRLNEIFSSVKQALQHQRNKH